MHFNIYGVFDSLYSHQHVSAAIATIYRVMLKLQQYKSRNVISNFTDTQKIKLLKFQLKLLYEYRLK
jgi:hypothetical protein